MVSAFSPHYCRTNNLSIYDAYFCVDVASFMIKCSNHCIHTTIQICVRFGVDVNKDFLYFPAVAGTIVSNFTEFKMKYLTPKIKRNYIIRDFRNIMYPFDNFDNVNVCFVWNHILFERAFWVRLSHLLSCS